MQLLFAAPLLVTHPPALIAIVQQLHRRAAMGSLSRVRIESAGALAMAGDFDHQHACTYMSAQASLAAGVND
jgi:hypothetical protein